MPNNFRLGLIFSLIAIIVDQASKWWILLKVMNPPKVVPITPFFNLVLTWNRGISFGMFNNNGSLGAWVFSVLALVIVGFMLFWLSKADNKLTSVSLGLMIGGALGNVIDRVAHLAVMDFLDFYLGGGHWPAFNAADSFITVGAAILIVDSLFSRQKSHTKMANYKKPGNYR